MLIPFKVKLLSLPENVEFRFGHNRKFGKDFELEISDLLTSTWLVTAIKPNPPGKVRIGTQGYEEDPHFVSRSEYGESYSLSANLFLLIREEKIPLWWPDTYCQVVADET